MLRKLFPFFLLTALLFATTLNAVPKKVTLSGTQEKNGVERLSAAKISEGLSFVEQEVYNPYEKRSELYGGVLLDAFVKKYAKEGVKELKLKALDGYTAVIPRTLWESERILLVTHLNGKPTTIKTKGPLQIVFLDFDPNTQKYQKTIPLWIWMVTKIEFK